MIQAEIVRTADDPAISVVVATIPANDHDTVCSHLCDQAFDAEWEVIVVNDPNLDRCEARNVGLMEATGEVVAFTDDDTKPPRDWLQSISESFAANPELVCVEGRVTGGIEYSGRGQYVGCNMAVDRAAAIAVGGWDSRYAGWREDTEFGWRLEIDTDGDCEYHDEVVMVHPDVPRTTYNRHRERLLKREYPERYRERFDRTLVARLWRYGQVVGLVPYVNRLRSALS
jgi:cellulose synthase/poly-beta-1,6-N-acetylglucosamine synthase-like glycosyltransferase